MSGEAFVEYGRGLVNSSPAVDVMFQLVLGSWLTSPTTRSKGGPQSLAHPQVTGGLKLSVSLKNKGTSWQLPLDFSVFCLV